MTCSFGCGLEATSRKRDHRYEHVHVRAPILWVVPVVSGMGCVG